MLKTAVAVRHLAFEDLGCFEPVLSRAGYQVHSYDIGIHELPTFEAVEADLLIVLGGPIGACEDHKYPFLSEEIGVLEQRLVAGRPTIGVCLGAQLMARALGARVYPGREKEIGFAPVRLTDKGRASCLAAFDGGPVLHWHGDTFDLPEGATRLASSDVCENQAFAYGRGAIGFQFHPEAGGNGFERWLIGHAIELAQAEVDVPALRAAHAAHASGLARRADACLQEWLDQLNR